MSPLPQPVAGLQRAPLVPRLGPLPEGWPAIGVLASLVAWALCLPASLNPTSLIVGGAPDLPGLTHTASQMALRGPGVWSHSRLIMYPSLHNLYSEFSFPADGLLAAPLISLLGWPAGFTAFSVLSLALAGATAGLLAASWWRSLSAGLLAVIALQTSGVVLRELYEGRLTHVMGLALAPIAVAFFCRGLVEDRGRWSFLAGLAVGGSALIFWYQAVWVGLMLLAIFFAGVLERLPVARQTAWGALGTMLVAGFPLIFTALHAGSHPGSQLGAWDLVEEIPGEPVALVSLLEGRDVGGMGYRTGAWAPRPLLLGACLLGLAAGPARRIVVPIAWILLAWLLAEGPVFGLPGAKIISPVILQSLVPLMRRYWWPDRYLLMASLGVAILVGGGLLAWLRGLPPLRQRLAMALAGAALLTEAALLLPTLPMASTPGPDPERVAALLSRSGPLLMVPVKDLDPDARNQVWYSERLLEQIAHQRPLLTGPMNPEAVVAGPLYHAFWMGGLLRAIRDCELSHPPERGEDWASEVQASKDRLYRVGLREVTADPLLEGPEEVATAWRTCLEGLLGPPSAQEGPFRIYELRPPGQAQAPPVAPPAPETEPPPG